MPQNYKPDITVGDLLKVFNRRSRQFEQLQAIEACVQNNKDVQDILERSLKSRALLGPDEHIMPIIQRIRSDEFARLASLRDVIHQIPLDQADVSRIQVQTRDGIVHLQEPLGELMDHSVVPEGD